MNVKNNYRKIGKKKDNNVDIDVAQLERNNNKWYTSIYIYIYGWVQVTPSVTLSNVTPLNTPSVPFFLSCF